MVIKLTIPDDVVAKIKTEFPSAIVVAHAGMMTSGVAVEITRDGKPWRNGWPLPRDNIDWDVVGEEILQWLRANPDG